MKKELQKVVESLVLDKSDEATIHFHKYISDKIQGTIVNEGSKKLKTPLKLDKRFSVVGYGRDMNGNPIVRYEDSDSGKKRTAQKSYALGRTSYADFKDGTVPSDVKAGLLTQAKELFEMMYEDEEEMDVDYVEYTIPEHLSGYIEYGEGELSDEEEMEVKKFMSDVRHEHGKGHWDMVDGSKDEFTHSNDVNDKGGSVVKYHYVITEK